MILIVLIVKTFLDKDVWVIDKDIYQENENKKNHVVFLWL